MKTAHQDAIDMCRRRDARIAELEAQLAAVTAERDGLRECLYNSVGNNVAWDTLRHKLLTDYEAHAGQEEGHD